LYTLAGAGPAPVDRPENVSYKWAGGGLVSTPSDLVRLADAYASGFLLPATVAAMFASQRDASGAATGVGIGWRGSRDMDGRRVFEHAGSMQGARSVVCLFPDDRVAVAVMANAEWSSSIEETAHMLALPYLAPPAPRPQPAGTFDVAATSVNGRNVATAWTGTMTLRAGRGALALGPAAGERQVYPLVYLGRGDVYALVRPDGVYHLTLAARGDSVTGRATGYGSPMVRPPAENPPFFTLRAHRAGRSAAARR
jgi:hypothetical protein